MLIYLENIIIIVNIVVVVCVIFLGSPIQSLLMLILSFALSAILFLILGLEFISLLIFMVYVGAIAVLFLFVIMMLNIKIVELRNTYYRYLPIGAFIILFFLFNLCLFFYLDFNYMYIDIFFID